MRHFVHLEEEFSRPPLSEKKAAKLFDVSSMPEIAKSDSSGGSNTASCVSVPLRHEEDAEDDFQPNDPFYDRSPWFRVIGRCYIYLANLFYGVSQEHDIALIDRNGEPAGFIHVLVEPLQAVTGAGEEKEKGSKEDSKPVVGKCPSPLFSPNAEGCQRSGQSTLVFKDAEYFRQVCSDGRWNDERLAFGSPGPLPTRMQTPLTVMPERGDTLVEEEDDDERNTPRVQHGRFFPADSTTSDTEPVFDKYQYDAPWLTADDLPSHLRLGCQFQFRVTILEVHGICNVFDDIFCQFFFENKRAEVYSTDPLPNRQPTSRIEFCQVQSVSSLTGSKYTKWAFIHGILLHQSDLLVWFEILELSDAGE
ncbi:unnamed protein product [Dibothriocephalus latus]|uniref:Uncharacterized protein n=1 Tax=Dibothriocephalus latus TaxID=60516 RepID=A0A3P6UHM9_DIBLA|nr:unnamed protein product [Dibothriocephalus latus]